MAQRRDGVAVGPVPGEPVAAWLAGFNGEWVDASRRLSPAVVADLLDVAGEWFEEHISSLDLDAIGPPVIWAGTRPAPVWMDVAREFSERWVHQQQIREAVQRPGSTEPRFVAPVLGAFVHALPVALSPVAAKEGRAVNLQVTGDGGGTWHVVRWHSEWDLWPGAHNQPMANVTTTVDNAWRLFTGHPQASPPEVTGDPILGAAVSQAVAIIA